MNKDNLIGFGMAIFFGIFGAMIVFSFNVTSVIAGMFGALVGICGATAFKEWRRGRYEGRPKRWYLPYIIGGIVAEILTILMCP